MIRSTTIVAVRRNGRTALGSDGQVTLGEQIIVKHTAKKVARLSGGKVLCGFAGAAADARALMDRFEDKLVAFGNLKRAAVEFAKEWRTDRMLRQLNAMMIVADAEDLLLVSGDGNVIEPDDGLAAIGSGGPIALGAARALAENTELDAESIVRTSLRIAAEMCVYTNHEITVEVL